MARQSVAVNLMGPLETPKGRLIEALHAVLDSFDTGIQHIELLDQPCKVGIALTQALQLQALPGQFTG